MTTYYIGFDTDVPAPGWITGTKIIISREAVSAKESAKRKFNIALRDDPLYPQLVDYVRNNPPVKKENA